MENSEINMSIRLLRGRGFTDVVLVSIALGLTTLLAGCQAVSDITADSKKPDFHVLGQAMLHGEMRLMAAELRILLDTHLDDSLPEPGRQQKALAALNRIQSIASGIGGDDVVTNYSVINDYMGAFLYDVGVAKEFAMKNPPNYFPGGTLIKSCLSCHQSI